MLERSLRAKLPRIQAALSRHEWGAPLEATALGAITGLVIALSGVGGEFIYFQF